MKYVEFIFCALSLFFLSTRGMEKSPRVLEALAHWNPQELAQACDLLYIIESEASYANPHAPARINQAGLQLLSIPNKELISETWNASCSRTNAALLYERSREVMNKNRNTIFAASADLLHQQAKQIFLAIAELNEKISFLK